LIFGFRLNTTQQASGIRHQPNAQYPMITKHYSSSVSTMTDGLDGETYIIPTLDDDNFEMIHSCNSPAVSPTNEKENNVPANNDEIVSTAVALRLRVNSDDSFPIHLASIDDTDLKDPDALRENRVHNILDHTADEDGDRVQIYQASSPSSTPRAPKTKSSHKTKEHFLILCLVLFIILTVTLTWQLHLSTVLNLQLQAELNHTNGVLKDYRSHQSWMLNREMKEDTNSFQIENCWLEASINLGPCAYDPFGNANNAYKQTYEDLYSYFDEAWNWWTVLPNDSNSSDSIDLSAENSWFEKASRSVLLNAKELIAGSSNNAPYPSHL